MDHTKLISAFEAADQGHVFSHWENLNAAARQQLLQQANEIDLQELDQLIHELVKGNADSQLDWDRLEPAPYEPHPLHGGSAETWAKAKAEGEAALRAHRVAAFTVAGGQGTRLGYDGPKGTYPVTPVKQKALFQVFAEKIKAASMRYHTEIPWLIMTSHANHEATRAFFETHAYFSLNPRQVIFFTQGRMPAVDFEGKIILEAPDSIAMSPDGHGGSLRALVRSGALAHLEEKGIDIISYFQVDNPLVQSIDPAFIGFHVLAGSEMSSKMIPKAYPLEKLGHFCRLDDRTIVVEYSDMPESMQEARNADGELVYRAGSIAIHLLDVGFVKRAAEGSNRLPFHRAKKKIPALQPNGETLKPEEPNGIKFEMFVFDALPLAQNPVIIETLREDDFSPVKNAEGQDSPQTCRDDQMRQFARWLQAAGENLKTQENGLPEYILEISPLFADSQAVFLEKWPQLSPKPTLHDGLYLE